MRRIDEVLEIVIVDVLADHGAPLPEAPATRREKLSEAFNRNEKLSGLAKPWPKASKRTAVGLDQLRTRQGAEPYTVSIATAIRTKSN